MPKDRKQIWVRDEANIAFDEKNFEQAMGERDRAKNAPDPLPDPPQPTLRPEGPLRDQVDAKVREKQQAIKAKMRGDREHAIERHK